MIQNNYEILGVKYDADEDTIRRAYTEKMQNCSSELMREKYKTAYYKLMDGERRYNYDLSLGIHRYRKVGFVRKLFRQVIRAFLTFTDALMTFYWCFLFVLVVYALGDYYYRNGVIEITALVQQYKDELYILALLAMLDALLHYYVRRINRYLKHYKWEVRNYKEYKKIKEKEKRKNVKR